MLSRRLGRLVALSPAVILFQRREVPRSPSSHTKRKSMYNQVYGVVGRNKGVMAFERRFLGPLSKT